MSYKVLLVDDEQIYLQYMQKMIDWELLECHICGCAHNGIEALEMAEEMAPDIILMDINMSHMDGLAACSRLRDRKCETKVIIMTAFDEFSFAHQAIKLNVSDYLLKPFDGEELSRSLEKCISEIKKEQELEKNRQEEMLKEILDSGIEGHGHIKKMLSGCNYTAVLLPKQKESLLGEKEKFRRLLDQYFAPYSIKSFFLGNQKESRIVIHTTEDKDVTISRIKDQYNKMLAEHSEENIEWVAIGTIVNGMEKLSETYRNARLVQENRVKLSAPVNSFEDVEKLNSQITTLTQDEVDVLIKAFEMKRYDKVDKSIEKIFALSQNQMFSFQFIIATYYSLITEIYSYFNYNGQGELLNVLGTQTSLIEEIAACSTKDQMLDIVKNYVYEAFSACMGVPAGNKKEVLTSKIEKYLQQHYCEQSLSVRQIADQLYFENSYIRRVFRMQTGKTIIQRLEEIRIEKAKEMLKEGIYKNSEIAEKTGYCDQQYFSKRFKIVCGYTPSQYQKKMEES